MNYYLLSNRSFSSKEYRYGFNGMEKDDEMKNVGGASYDFGARMYDSRLGRWMSIDPLAAKYPSMSPYNFVGNSPILYVDYDGKDYGVNINHNPNNPTITIVSNVYVSDFFRRGAAVNFQHAFSQMQLSAAWMNTQTAVYRVRQPNGTNIDYNINFQINVIAEDDVKNPERGKDPIQTAADNDPIGNSFAVWIMPEDKTVQDVKDGETRGNQDIVNYHYMPLPKPYNYIYPDHVTPQGPDVTDLHELGHTMLGSQFSDWLHLQNNTIMASTEPNNPVAPLLGITNVRLMTPGLSLPNNFFGIILSQGGMGNINGSGVIATGAPTNPFGGIQNQTGNAPVNFNNGTVLGGQ